jgi:hypothetical protein
MAKILILQDQLPDAVSMYIRKDLPDSIKEFLNWVFHLGGECENQIHCVIVAKLLENKTAIPFPQRDILNFNYYY